jgi:nitrile hydratase
MLLTPDMVPGAVAAGLSARMDVPVEPRFSVGETVRVHNFNKTTHTRLPGYLRGKLGQVVKDYGVFLFPDTHAHGEGETPQHCYSVMFTASEVWGPTASKVDKLYVDLFDDYLDEA